AAIGVRMLVIEADLRNPVLAARLGLSRRKGLSQLLTGQATLEDVTVGVPLPSAAPRDGHDAPEVDVILAGRTPPNPIELIESPAMRNLISEAEDRYDLVIIDTPPVMVIPDAISLIGVVNGVIVVSRIGQTTREAA